MYLVHIQLRVVISLFTLRCSRYFGAAKHQVKKVCNIRVVALSGEPLGLLDCFGRYGAGFATGLLVFYKYIGIQTGKSFKIKYQPLWLLKVT